MKLLPRSLRPAALRSTLAGSEAASSDASSRDDENAADQVPAESERLLQVTASRPTAIRPAALRTILRRPAALRASTGSLRPDLASRAELHTTTVRAARGGDQFAFAVLFQWSAPAIDAYLAPLAVDEDDGLERLQRVFVRAWRELPALRDPSAFDLWLLRLAHDEVSASLEDASTPRPLRGYGAVLLRTAYELPRPYRETLALRYLFGHSTARAATTFGVAEDLVARWDEEALGELAEVSRGRTLPAAA